jgi:cell division protein FtsL
MTKANVFLGVLVWVSAFALISSQYRVRQLTIEINRARDVAYQLENDHTRSILVQSKLSTPSRVETAARDHFAMELPEMSRAAIVDVPARVAVSTGSIAANATPVTNRGAQ